MHMPTALISGMKSCVPCFMTKIYMSDLEREKEKKEFTYHNFVWGVMPAEMNLMVCFFEHLFFSGGGGGNF